MEIKNLPLKFVLLALVLALCVWSLDLTPYPGPGLLEGLDLRGGVSMTFQIQQDSGDTGVDLTGEDLTSEMIDNLKRRLDPNGLMGLQFLPLRNNRICIRMPAAQPETLEAERLFREAMESLREGNLTKTQVRHFLAIEAPGVQEARALELANENEARLALLTALRDAYHAKVEAQQVFDDAVTMADKTEAQVAVDETAVAYLRAERALFETNINLDALRSNLLTNYVTPREAKILATTKDGDAKIKARQDELDRHLASLNEAHPNRTDDIQNARETYQAWAKLRQTLGDPSTLKRMVAKAGVLEFRIAPFAPGFQALGRDGQPSDKLAADRLSSAKLTTLLASLEANGPEGISKDEPYAWFPVRDEGQPFPNIVTARYGGRKYVLLYTRPDKVMLADRGDAGWVLKDAKEDFDYDQGRPAVSFTLDGTGKKLFGRLTSENVDRQMAILLDGEVYNAPHIQTAIVQGRGQITTTYQDRPELCRTLRAGSLPAMLDPTPISENNFGPSLGQDNKEMGLRAGIWGLIAVAAFMLFYYLLAGGIADIALMVNLLLVLGFMSLFRVVLTLPGIAGLLLTIGIAVDANVLIFERLREEQRKGQSPSMTIANAYRRAFSAIFDANLTTLITCLILGWIGTPEVRGFAVTLGLGVLFSMFSALVVTRWFFQLLLNLGVIKEHVAMMRIIKTPKVNWIGKRYFFWSISAILIVSGILSLGWQGSNVMGIEFSSGTQAVITFRDDAMLTPPGADKPELLSDGVVRAIFEAQAGKLNPEEGDKLLATARVEERLTDRHDLVRTFLTNNAGEDATVVTLDQFKAQDGNMLFFAAIDANGDNVLDKDELLDRLPANEYQISTTEERTQLVTDVISDAFGDQLQRRAACDFTLLEGRYVETLGLTTAADGLTRVPDLKNSARRDLFEGFEGGVVFVLTDVTPMTEADLTNRRDLIRYQPDFAEVGLTQATIVGLNATDDGKFDAFAVIVAKPDTLDVGNTDAWTSFAQDEKTILVSALEMQDTLEMRNFDAQIAKQARGMAVMAIILSCFAIVLYLWLRFGSLSWGIAAVVCLAHDVIIVVGLVAASGWLYDTAFGKALAIRSFKIDLAMVAAFLTVIGYSVNDTIVVFDRIRENRGRSSTITPDIINRSINQTLSRTLLTSMTTLIVVVIMYIWGGPGIHAFSFALLAGVIFGTYSSIAVASPLLLGIRKAIGRVVVISDAPVDEEDAEDDSDSSADDDDGGEE